MNGVVIDYGTRARRDDKGRAPCNATPGQPITQRVGPLEVTTTAPCEIQARVGGLAFAVPCAVLVRNVSDRPVAIMAQNSSGSPTQNLGGGGGLGATIGRLPNTLVETAITTTTVGPMRLDPGQQQALPAPAPGTSWMVVDIDPRAIQRAGWVAGGVAAVVGAGVVYGGVKAVQAITHRRRR